MSLTSELNNPKSPISKWFADKYHQGVGKIIAHHNTMMSHSSIIKPIEGTNFPLVGNAITYGLRKFVAQKKKDEKWLNSTLAGEASFKLGLDELASFCSENNSTAENEALKLLVLGGLESYYRNHKIHEIIQPFFYNKNKLNLSQEYIEHWIPSIQDVCQIMKEIPAIWQNIDLIIDINGHVTSNATFYLSELIHADCQMIIGNAIVDIRTTAKKKPFTLNNLYQQLSYLLFDSNNEYNINRLVWIYPRQKIVFHYSVNKLFKNIDVTRMEFKQMIKNNYGYRVNILRS